MKEYEEIEDYLEGRLDEEQQAALEQKIEAEPAFYRQVKLHRELNQALSDQQTMELESQLMDIRKERLSEPKKAAIRPIYRRFRPLAAAIALLVIAGLAYLIWPAQEASLFTDYYEPYPLYLNIQRSDDAALSAPLQKATARYSADDYAAALPVFQALLAEQPDDAGLHFYAGICQLELEHPIEAAVHFRQVARQQDARFGQAAEWYLALAYLQQGQVRDARRILLDIASGQGSFRPSAQSLLEDLSDQ